MKINGSDGVNHFGMVTKNKTGQNVTLSSKEDSNVLSEEAGVTLELSDNSRGRVDVGIVSASVIKEQMERLQEQSKAAEKSGIVNSKCMTIAMRIASGDEVPLKDVIYLQKNRSDLYDMAMRMRIPKADPKKYDSITDDEEDENTSNGNISGSSESNIDTSESVCVEVSESVEV